MARRAGLLAIAVSGAILATGAPSKRSAQTVETVRVIVRGADSAAAATAVRDAGGTVLAELAVIDAVGAELPAGLLPRLRRPGVRAVYPDRSARVSLLPFPIGGGGAPPPPPASLDTHYPTLVNANGLHELGIDGGGVGVAVIDTGLWEGSPLVGLDPQRPLFNVVARHDATARDGLSGFLRRFVNPDPTPDTNGHGSHVTSIIGSNAGVSDGAVVRYNGIAPGADLVVVRAFLHEGTATYIDVVKAIDWVIRNRELYNIRVLNMSFSAPVQSYYWDDPINLATMAAWQAGIVVVAAAGNRGPDPMTVGVPGNTPYVVTVGAMTDSYTPGIGGDDRLASFSSAGPSYEGFVKPELVAPGGHVLGVVPDNSFLAWTFPERVEQVGAYFSLSGTSQATAVVSGVAALLLQADPSLTPDDVKCALLDGARVAVDAEGGAAYSVFQQGAGLVDAHAAVTGGRRGCANNGLDVAADLSGEAHFAGRANQHEDGSFYLMGAEGGAGYSWDGLYESNQGFLWAEGFLWTEGLLWAEGFLWTDGFLWTEGLLWAEGLLWTDALSTPVDVNDVAAQE